MKFQVCFLGKIRKISPLCFCWISPESSNGNKALSKFVADNILKSIFHCFFFFFSEKIRLDILCELSACHAIHIKCPVLFSLKITISRLTVHMECQTLFDMVKEKTKHSFFNILISLPPQNWTPFWKAFNVNALPWEFFENSKTKSVSSAVIVISALRLSHIWYCAYQKLRNLSSILDFTSDEMIISWPWQLVRIITIIFRTSFSQTRIIYATES